MRSGGRKLWTQEVRRILERKASNFSNEKSRPTVSSVWKKARTKPQRTVAESGVNFCLTLDGRACGVARGDHSTTVGIRQSSFMWIGTSRTAFLSKAETDAVLGVPFHSFGLRISLVIRLPIPLDRIGQSLLYPRLLTGTGSC